MKKLLIANRGEIAVRIARAAHEMQAQSVGVYAEDDARSLHRAAVHTACPLAGAGPQAYLDADALIRIAKDGHCDSIHPGVGFLSESAAFARACREAGLLFIGPDTKILDLFGDKARARAFAHAADVPVLRATEGGVSLDGARDFLAGLGKKGAVMLKAVAGGGGLGMRVVRDASELEAAFERAGSEARRAFGSDALYAEELIPRARHIEIQILGDGKGVAHLGERDCTLQRRRQKLVEVAPAPNLAPETLAEIEDAAMRLAKKAHFDTIGTAEFLLDTENPTRFAFIELNPRLQVEHTITEEIYGIDLVKAQMRLAEGAKLGDVGIASAPKARGTAIELRITMEEMDADGNVRPSTGRLDMFSPPSGPGIRIDTFGYAGYAPSTRYDSLLAKLIIHAEGGYADALARARAALGAFHIAGVKTNIPLLESLLDTKDVTTYALHTTYIAEKSKALHAAMSAHTAPDFLRASSDAPEPQPTHALAPTTAPQGTRAISAPMQGRVVSLDVKEGEIIARGAQIAVLEAMKMEHTVNADIGGIVRTLCVAPEEVVAAGAPVIFVEEQETGAVAEDVLDAADLDRIRPDLAEVQARHAVGLDANRPKAVARRRARGQRTARENIDDLCDAESFIEYGSLVLAAQRQRRSMEELIEMSPADGLITGMGTINAASFGADAARAMVLAYDFTVFAGTQGKMNHKKTDRMLALARQWSLPVILFAEGGGGRPGDTDAAAVAGLDTPSFQSFAALSGDVPLIGIVSGRCFAGNAALLGCCDVIIATADANIGMGGPAMIEGGGLGVFKPEEVGPMSVQTKNGVVDIACADEAEAVAHAKTYLACLQGTLETWDAEDPRFLRHAIPENRLRAYDVRAVITKLVDMGSFLEMRAEFGIGIITGFVRIEGRAFGLMANNPFHLGGAIDADAADKAARFMQLCDSYNLPLISLCDTPGFMVGPEIEAEAHVRHASRMFVVGANISVPVFTIVLRKGYGLGAQAMAGGSFHAPVFTVSWPTGEFGGMGLEGAVRLGFRREMEAIDDPAKRQAFYESMVAKSYERGKSINMAAFLEIDEVIDPAETRRWLVRGIASVPQREKARGRGFIDSW